MFYFFIFDILPAADNDIINSFDLI